jgi:plastocyanin
MIKVCLLSPIFYSVVIITFMLVITFSLFASNALPTGSAQEGTSQQQQPNINATSLLGTGQMIVPSNVKHLVILIPNEGHHGPGEEDESRFIAQPFVPQNVIVDSGTQVAWFNGDVGHEHNIVVNDNNGNQIFQTGEFTELAASRPITLNNTGSFGYADTVEYEEGFVMTGNVTVADGGNNSPATSSGTYDTVGALMVPSPMVQSITGEMRNAGFDIDSTHMFTDLRGGQEDTGDQQALVVWTATGKGLEEITSYLGEISEPLPYE